MHGAMTIHRDQICANCRKPIPQGPFQWDGLFLSGQSTKGPPDKRASGFVGSQCSSKERTEK